MTFFFRVGVLHCVHVQCSSPSGRCKRGEPTAPDGVLSNMTGPSNRKAGEVVILSLCGHDLRQGLALLHRILRGAPGGGLANAASWGVFRVEVVVLKGETPKLEHHPTIPIGVTLQKACIVYFIFLSNIKL